MDKRFFGVRPYPENHESYQGYFLRLAWLNGLPHLKSLFETIGMVRANERNIGRWDTAHLEVVCEKLADFLNRSPAQVDEPFRNMCASSLTYDQTRMIQDIRVNHPRVCPLCMAVGGYIHQYWGLAVTAHCQQHHCMLLDHCPRCTKPLSWKSALFEGCDQCQMTWAEYSPPRSTPSSLEQLVTSQLENNEVDRDRLKDLCATIVIAARPFDSMHQSMGSIGLIEGYSALVTQAYALLDSHEEQQRWRQACVLERHDVGTLGESALLRPLLNLNTKLSKPIDFDQFESSHAEQAQTGEWAFTEYNDVIKPSRTRSLSEDPLALRYQVTLHELASVLDIPSSEVQALVDSGAIVPTNTTTVLRDQLFDLRPLARLVGQISGLGKNSGDHCCNPVAVAKDSGLFRRHLTSYGTLLGAALTGQVRAYLDDSRCLSSIHVEEPDLLHWLDQQLSMACEQPVAVHRAARALACSDKKIREFARQGALTWARWSQNGERVDGESLHKLLEQTMIKDMEVRQDAESL